MSHLRYLRYVLAHKWFVFIAGLRTGAPLWRLVIHDWSKLTPREWGAYVASFYGGWKYRRGLTTNAFIPPLMPNAPDAPARLTAERERMIREVAAMERVRADLIDGTNIVSTLLAELDAVRGEKHELAKFFDKYALGPKSAPSCLVCGNITTKPGIEHMELPGIVVCSACVSAPACFCAGGLCPKCESVRPTREAHL